MKEDDNTCSMHSCEFPASESDTIWNVDPSNTSQKPVCKYHYIIKESMDSPILPIVSMAITYLLFFSVFSGLTGVVSILGMIASFLISLFILFIGMISLEFAVRYLFMDIPALRVRQHTVSEEGKLRSEECICCGESDCSGVWKQYRKSFELFGTPIRKYNQGINHYCSDCYEDEFGEDNEQEQKQENEQNILLSKSSN